jgi:cytochrome c-type biogenesis protein CcmH
MSRGRRLLVVLALGAFLSAGVVLAGAVRDPAPVPLAERVEALSREVRCPVCGGETVAESQSDVASAMRAEIADQLARGRSSSQVREWFAQRYGSEVLLRPATDGAGSVVWLLPAVALGAGVVLAGRVVGGSGGRRLVPVAVALVVASALAVPALLEAGKDASVPAAGADDLAGLRAAASAGDAASWVALGRALSAEERHAEAVDAYRAALTAGADEQEVSLPLGLALVRSGRPEEAVDLLRRVVDARPDEPEALLVLAAALRDSQPDEARAVLRRFLAVAPDHAGAPGVRRALGEEAP